MQSKNAVGNLINRYRAVLSKCALLNAFGSLAIAGLLITSPVSALAATGIITPGWTDSFVDGDDYITADGGLVNNQYTEQTISLGQYNGKIINSLTIGNYTQSLAGAIMFGQGGTFTVTNDVKLVANDVSDWLQGSRLETAGATQFIVNGNMSLEGNSRLFANGSSHIQIAKDFTIDGEYAQFSFYNDAAKVTVGGDFNLVNNQSFSIQSGTLTVKGESNIGGGNKATLNITNNNNHFIAEGTVNILTNGTLNASSVFQATGQTVNVDGGTLNMAANYTNASMEKIHITNGGYVKFGATSTWGTRTLSVGAGGIIVEDGTFEFARYGNYTNLGTLTILENGTLKLGANHAYNSNTNYELIGTLLLDTNSSYESGAGNDLTIKDNGKVQLSGSGSKVHVRGTTNINDNAAITVASGTTFNAYGATSMTGGTLDISGTYNAGTVGDASTNMTVAGGNVNILNGGAYILNSGLDISAGAFNNMGSVAFDTYTVSGGTYKNTADASGNTGVTKTNSVNISSGAVIVDNGVFEFTADSGLISAANGAFQVTGKGQVNVTEAFVATIVDGTNEMDLSNGATVFIKDTKTYNTNELQDLLATLDMDENSDDAASIYATNVVLGDRAILANNNVDVVQLGFNNVDLTTNTLGANAVAEYRNGLASSASYTANNMVMQAGDIMNMGAGNVKLITLGGNIATKADGTLVDSLELADGTNLAIEGSGVMSIVNANDGAFSARGDYTFDELNMGKLDTYLAGNIEANKISSAGGIINVGEISSTSSLKTDAVVDGVVYVKQNWGNSADADITTATKLLTHTASNSSLIVGNNAIAVVGDTSVPNPLNNQSFANADEWLKDKMDIAVGGAGDALKWGASGNTGAVFALYGNKYTVGADKTLTVQGALTAGIDSTTASYMNNTVSFAPTSLFVLDASIPNIASTLGSSGHVSGSEYALNLDTGVRLTVTGGAKLYLTNIPLTDDGSTLINVAEFSSGRLYDNAWGYDEDAVNSVSRETIYFENAFFRLDEVFKDSDSYQVLVKQISISEALPGLNEGLLGIIEDGLGRAVRSPQMSYLNALSLYSESGEESARTMEGAANLGVAGGAFQSVMDVVGNATLHAGKRTSLIQDMSGNGTGGISSGSETKDTRPYLYTSDGRKIYPSDLPSYEYVEGLGIWFSPMYQYTSSNQLESGSGNYGYDTNLYGASIGADYTFNEQFRVGASFFGGNGDSESTGSFAKTQSDIDYMGASIYGGYRYDNLVVSADFAYSETSNDTTQSLSTGDLSADIDTSSYSFGAKAEYLFATEMLFDLVPYTGFRYMNIDVDAYDSKTTTDTIFKTEATEANIFSLPFGLASSRSFVTEQGYILTPRFDLGIIYSFGDLEIDQAVSLDTLNGTALMSSDILDPFVFTASVGLGFDYQNFDIDFDYTVNLSSNINSHNVMANFKYNF